MNVIFPLILSSFGEFLLRTALFLFSKVIDIFLKFAGSVLPASSFPPTISNTSKIPIVNHTPRKNEVSSESEVFYVDGQFLIKIVSAFTSYKYGRDHSHKLPEKFASQKEKYKSL